MATFVLVPGAWHGGWSFDPVVPLLERAGHRVHPLTLTGLNVDDTPDTAPANLDTHADDVLRRLDRAHLTDITLVGHSYGGMVIAAAAADRAAGRVTRLVHLDAYVPLDGESCWSATTEQYQRLFVAGSARTGYAVDPPFRPPKGGDPRRRPHPLASLVQSVRLTGAATRVPRRDFIYCSGWDGTPFTDLRRRLAADPGWRVHTLPTAHDAMREDPHATVALLTAPHPSDQVRDKHDP